MGLTQELAARVQRATDEHSGWCFQWEGHNGNVWNCSKNHLHLKRTKALWQSVDTSLKTLVFTAAAAAGARGPAVFRAVLFFFARLCNSLQPPKDLNTSQLFLSLIFLSLRTNGLLYTRGSYSTTTHKSNNSFPTFFDWYILHWKSHTQTCQTKVQVMK